MPARKRRPADEKPQRERFIETARAIGASEDLADFERAFKLIVGPSPKADVPPSDPVGRKTNG